MMRWRNSSKSRSLELELSLLLRNLTRYPGDVLQGVAVVDLAAPTDMIALEVRLCGEEKSSIGGFPIVEKNPETRRTLYFEQFITLRGVEHDALEQRRTLLGRRRTVVTADTTRPLSGAGLASPAVMNGSVDASPSLDPPSGEQSTVDFTPTMVSGATFVHLSPGTYAFPFKVALPDTIPPSRELARTREAHSVLQYTAVVTLVVTGGKTYTSEARFRVNPLPVQIQRWYELHTDEQVGAEGAAQEGQREEDALQHDSVAGDTASRVSIRSRLMSTAGTTRVDMEDREREVACQRRLHHFRQFSPERIAEERAEFDNASTTKDLSMKEDKSKGRKSKDHRGRTRDLEVHSMDSQEDLRAGAASAEADGLEAEDEDQVQVFGAARSDSTRTPPPTQPLQGPSAEAPPASDPATPAAHRKKKRHHHNSRGEEAEGAAEAPPASSSAMVTNAVEQLAFTPPDADLVPTAAHLAVHAGSPTAPTRAGAVVSKKTKHAKKTSVKEVLEVEENEEGDADEKEGSHHRRRYVTPRWSQEYMISLRGGFLRSGKVKAKLTLRSPIVTVGAGKVVAKLLIDNDDGGGTITRIKYSLVTRCYVRSRAEVYNYHVDLVEIATDVNIEKGSVVRVPEIELPVPKSSPLTILTEGMGTFTFLNIRLYVRTSLKTFSKSFETEVLVVAGQDAKNSSRRLLGWTCCFRRRNHSDTREVAVHAPTLNLSSQNEKLRIIEADAMAAQPNVAFANGGTDTASSAASTMSRSLMLLRNSKRLAKETPSMDMRRLASVLNYDEATFIPPTEDLGGNEAGAYRDPMGVANPFMRPSGDLGSTLPSADLRELI